MSQSTATQSKAVGIGEPGVEPDGVAALSVLIWGFVSVVLVIATILIAVALYNEVNQRLVEERVYAPKYNASLQSLSTQLGSISRYDVPSNSNPNYQIPVEDAMKLVVKELSAAQKAAN